ncbi:MAG TPA: polysaccharide export protein EpsE [Burkholderiales bacterium]|nr:polysaccharide export protein EpsE [Burkholderiales bacterium]
MTLNLHSLGKLLLAGLACIALSAGAQSTKGPAPGAHGQGPAAGAKAAKETLGAGDGVRVTVFQNPDLTTEGRLSESGSVVMPLIGEVSLAGLTPAQAGHRVAEKLKGGHYILNPQVTVSLLQVRSRQVSVLGQVNHPGKYALEDKTAHLTDILALAGGVAPGGADTVTVTHANGKSSGSVDVAAMMRTGDTAKNVEIQNGDTIFVGRAPTFYIHGEVQRAGIYRLEPHMTVMQALAAGGGITLRGTQRGMKIHRRSEQGNLQTLNAKLTDPVQADDVIFVKESLF